MHHPSDLSDLPMQIELTHTPRFASGLIRLAIETRAKRIAEAKVDEKPTGKGKTA